MSKTVTVRLEDTDYDKIKSAAQSENRTISNFIETHLLSEVLEKNYVDDEEMAFYNSDKEFLKNIKSSMNDIKNGKYKIVY
ncbi:MAG: hypothetical protein ABUK01_08360 [Leptospirales bacterium]